MGDEWEEKPEPWLAWVLDDLESNKEFLADGVYLFAVGLFSSVECRDIPAPDTVVTRTRNYLLNWRQPNGDHLYINVTSGGIWRYSINTSRYKQESLRVVKTNHVNAIRNVFETMFVVNSVQAMLSNLE